MPKSKDNSKNKPYVSNYPPLQEWLDKHEARCMWQVPMEPNPHNENDEDYDLHWTPSAYIECWFVGKRPVIITVRANQMGWDIYTALNTNSVAESLADAEARCGITGEEG